jgi:hypothetical protein
MKFKILKSCQLITPADSPHCQAGQIKDLPTETMGYVPEEYMVPYEALLWKQKSDALRLSAETELTLLNQFLHILHLPESETTEEAKWQLWEKSVKEITGNPDSNLPVITTVIFIWEFANSEDIMPHNKSFWKNRLQTRETLQITDDPVPL